MKITDGYKKVNIQMRIWDNQNSEWKHGGEDINQRLLYRLVYER